MKHFILAAYPTLGKIEIGGLKQNGGPKFHDCFQKIKKPEVLNESTTDQQP